jgi:hypothetical protein
VARAAKLKVFRTPIGFHDAYVAASSQKAALAAWGSDHDLFARGAAEIVTDPELTAEALAAPGKVIKRLRGTADEQMAALGPATPRARKTKRNKAFPSDKPHPRPRPRPDRQPLDSAQAALAEAEQRHAADHQAIVAEEKKLAGRRRALEQANDTEARRLQRAVERASTEYRRALDAWHEET